MNVFEQLRQVTNKETKMEILKDISGFYDYGTIGPVIPKSKKELRNFIDKSLKEVSEYSEHYGSIITITARTNVPCIMFELEDEILIGTYQEAINHYELCLKLNVSDEEAEEIAYESIKYLNMSNIDKIKLLLEKYQETNNHEFIEDICLILSDAIFPIDYKQGNSFNRFHYWDDIEVNGIDTPCIVEERHGYDYAFYPIVSIDSLRQILEEMLEEREIKGE